MPTEVPPAVAAEIAAIAEPSVPEGARLRKLIARSRARGDGPDEVLAWSLAGIAGDPVAHRKFDDKLSRLFTDLSNFNYPVNGDAAEEVVIGAGFHAAVIAAIRHLLGYSKPLVLEATTEVGGAFAVTKNPSFWMNSEITGGLPGAPWDGDQNCLNWLPGGPVQASYVTGREITDNTVMRFIIRAALIMHARTITRARVVSVRPRPTGRIDLNLDNGRVITAKRVFDARGMGPEKSPMVNGLRILSWSQAMRRMDTDFPFDGIRRIAVIGQGKSALCAVEAAFGIGPDVTLRSHAGGGVASRVELYAPDLPAQRQFWGDVVPSRYLRVGSHLPTGMSEPNGDGETEPLRGFGLYSDLVVRQELGYATSVPDGAMVNGRFYDLVIVCTGHTRPGDLITGAGAVTYDGFELNGRIVAKRPNGFEYYRVGPCADLAWTGPDFLSGIASNPDNRVAIHRLGPLTAQLASALPPPAK